MKSMSKRMTYVIMKELTEVSSVLIPDNVTVFTRNGRKIDRKIHQRQQCPAVKT